MYCSCVKRTYIVLVAVNCDKGDVFYIPLMYHSEEDDIKQIAQFFKERSKLDIDPSNGIIKTCTT